MKYHLASISHPLPEEEFFTTLMNDSRHKSESSGNEGLLIFYPLDCIDFSLLQKLNKYVICPETAKPIPTGVVKLPQTTKATI